MAKKKQEISTKITKVSLVIYCLIMAVALIAFVITSGLLKDYSYLYGFLLCLGPGLIFVFISFLLPLPQLISAKTGKGIIVVCVIAYVLKYAAIIGIPFIGLTFHEHFNRWVMLGTTLVAPITVIINKLIFANYVSKSAKNEQK